MSVQVTKLYTVHPAQSLVWLNACCSKVQQMIL